MGTKTSTKHAVATRAEWLKARLALLKEEKAHTRRGDALALKRRELPWVRVDKKYEFATDEGAATLKDLFQGRSQLLVYHFMFGPDFAAGCPSCSAIADGFNGFAVHLANHDVLLWAVSRAPLAKIKAYKKRMQWTFPWASSNGSDFNSDYSVGFSEEQQLHKGVEYNYRRMPPMTAAAARLRPAASTHAGMCGVDMGTFLRELPGMSSFVREGGSVYHAYSAYARGLDGMWGMYQWLDRAPKGRNEGDGVWWRRHDEYAKR
ncbi:MAG: DUF899 domain-containing protein [Elusimicrobiota bacterium]